MGNNRPDDTSIRRHMAFDARDRLPESFRACISPNMVDRDSFYVLAAKRDILVALMVMSGADRVGTPQHHEDSIWWRSQSEGAFLCNNIRVDTCKLLEFLGE